MASRFTTIDGFRVTLDAEDPGRSYIDNGLISGTLDKLERDRALQAIRGMREQGVEDTTITRIRRWVNRYTRKKGPGNSPTPS